MRVIAVAIVGEALRFVVTKASEREVGAYIRHVV